MRQTLLIATLLLPLSARATEPVRVQELLTTTETSSGERLVVNEHPKLRFSTYTIAPGARLPVHKHPFARYAYVQAGELDVTLTELDKTTHYKPGDVIVEAIDAWHFGVNHGKTPVKLLVIDQMPDDVDSNVVLQ